MANVTSQEQTANLIPGMAARLSVGGAATFLLLLAALHFIKTELDPSWHFVSEYSIGRHGWIMMLAFLSLALSCIAAFVAIRSQVETTAGKAGLVLLLATGAALAMAGIFAMDPITATKDQLTTHGNLHALASMVGIPGLPIAAVLISRSLGRNHAWFASKRSLMWAAHLTWISLLFMVIVLNVMVSKNGGKFGPDVLIGWPNRLVVVAYCGWLILVSWRARHFAGTAFVLFLALSGIGYAQDHENPNRGMGSIEPYLMPTRDSEIALARTAAPKAISEGATILVLSARGYETAVEGKNGFVCMVDRKWQAPFSDSEFWNPKVRAPICLNPQAVRSVLPVSLKRTQLALAGLSKREIMARLKTAFKRRELKSPDAGAMSFMMSKEQYLDDVNPKAVPHLMFYLANTIEPAHWGANLPNSPVAAAPDRLPDGTRELTYIFVVPVSTWSDGSGAPSQH